MRYQILPTNATKSAASLIWHFIKARPLMFFIYQVVSMGSAAELIIWPAFISHITQILYHAGDNKGDIISLCRTALIQYGIIVLVTHALARTKAYFSANFVSPRLEHDISAKMLEMVMSQSPLFFAKNSEEDITSRIESLTLGCVSIVSTFITILLPNLCAVTWIACSLFFLHWALGLCAITSVAIHLCILGLHIKKISNMTVVNSRSYNILTSKMSDALYNISSIRNFLNKGNEINTISIFFRRYMDTNIRSLMLTEKMNWGFAINHLLITAGLFMFLLISLFSTGKIEAELVDYALYAVITSLLFSIWSFSDALPKTFLTAGSCNEALSILCEQETIEPEEENPIKLAGHGVTIKSLTLYKKNRKILEDISIDIPHKKSTAIVGLSSTQRKTLIATISGDNTQYDGDIFLGKNHKISKLVPNSIRKNVTVITKDPILFNRSILDNIKYGKPDATFRQIEEAVRAARLENAILNLDNGYHTAITDHGYNLPYTIRYQITIARAILKDAPIVIVEEMVHRPSDKIEETIEAATMDLIRNKTSIVIAHKKETLKKMDSIIVFKDGKAIEEGAHFRLMANRRSHYSHLWKTNREYSEEVLIK